MQFSLINIIQVVIIWQSLLLGVILLTPKYSKRRSNIFLAILLFVIASHFCYNILLTQNILVHQLSRFSCCYGFLYGPLIYFYVKTHLIKGIFFKRIDWIHFLPFFTVFVGALFNIINCGSRLALFLIIAIFLYSILGLWKVYIYQRAILATTTQIAIPEIKWLRLLLIMMLIIIILDLIDAFLPVINIMNLQITMDEIVQIGILIIVNLITFQGLKNPQFFQQLTLHDINFGEELIKSQNKKYRNKLLDISNETIERISKYIKDDKPYLKPDLSLNTLAKSLEIHPKTLSQIINQYYKVNFSEYINDLRIKEAKKLLENNTINKLTIKEIMYDCGFNSRSVFNTFFKKSTGVTPTEFLSKLK